MCSVSTYFFFFYFLFLNICETYLKNRYHHDIESYKIQKPLFVDGIDKVKDAFSSLIGNHQQAAEVAGGVNIVSDGIKPILDDFSLNNNVEATQITGTQ